MWISDRRPRTKPAEISSLKPRHGREEVAAFFKELTEKVQLERREELEITAEDEQVVGEGRERDCEVYRVELFLKILAQFTADSAHCLS